MILWYRYAVCCGVPKTKTVPVPAVPILETLQVFLYPYRSLPATGTGTGRPGVWNKWPIWKPVPAKWVQVQVRPKVPGGYPWSSLVMALWHGNMMEHDRLLPFIVMLGLCVINNSLPTMLCIPYILPTYYCYSVQAESCAIISRRHSNFLVAKECNLRYFCLTVSMGGPVSVSHSWLWC